MRLSLALVMYESHIPSYTLPIAQYTNFTTPNWRGKNLYEYASRSHKAFIRTAQGTDITLVKAIFYDHC